jgi:hypothetical protein
MTMTTHLPTPLQTKMHLCSKQNHLTFFIPAEKSFVCLINLMMMLNGRGGGGHRDLQLAHFWWELVGNGEIERDVFVVDECKKKKCSRSIPIVCVDIFNYCRSFWDGLQYNIN